MNKQKSDYEYIIDASKYYLDGVPIPIHGIVMLRAGKYMTCFTNVPVSCLHHSLDGFEWGYGGSGPAELALNIMEYMITLLHLDKQARIPCHYGSCSGEAWLLHQDFKRDFINMVSDEGGIIPYSEVYTWLSSAMGTGAELPPMRVPKHPYLSIAYPHNLFESMRKIYGNMNTELSESAFLALLEGTIANYSPQHRFKVIKIKTAISPVSIVVNDSMATLEETEVALFAQSEIHDLFYDPTSWMIVVEE